MQLGRATRRRVEQHKARGVPHLVRQVLPLLDALGAVPDVLGRGHREQAEPDAVGTVDVDLVQRVDAGAEALRHPPAIGGLDHRMDVDVVEWDAARELDPHHHHAGDPEEDDLAGRGQEGRRIEGLELGCLLGPSEDGERPQRRAEPGVEHVLLLPELPPHAPHRSGGVSATYVSSQASQYHTGMRWPHHSWREMHQGRMFRIQSRYTRL